MQKILSPTWIETSVFKDDRGNLSVLSFRNLPFLPARFFHSSAKEVGTIRGEHAHRESWQLMLCLSGSVQVTCLWEGGFGDYILEPDGKALLVPPLVWSKQSFRVESSTLGVIASHEYDPDDYIYTVPYQN